jgi:Fe-Mn family superoxide dismutase
MTDQKFPPVTRREFLVMAGLGVSTLAVPGLANRPVKNSKGESTKKMAHELPPLPYDYNALEPYYSEEMLRLHHDKHHLAYVNGLNAAEEKVQAMAKSGDFAGAKPTAKELAFHGSGHILHSIFWNNMKKGGGGQPTGELADAINKQYGSYDAFKNLFIATANSTEGSGWAILAYRPMDGALVTLQAEKHENFTQWGVQPLLVLDVWEHAYYLQYQNKRPDFTKVFMDNLVNWDDVAKRYAEAKKKA